MKLRIFLFLTFLSCVCYSQNIHKPLIPGPPGTGLGVNSFSGGLFYSRTDLKIPCFGPEIDITFYYNSGTTGLNYGYGNGWTMTYSLYYIRSSPTQIKVRRENGREEIYTFSGGIWNSPAGYWDVLSEFQPGKFLLKTKDGTKFLFEDSTHKRITKISDRNNNDLVISYTDSLPTIITDASARSIFLDYNNGNLTTITDPNTSPPRTFGYNIDLAGNLTTVTDALRYTINYEYDFLRRLIKLTDKSYNIFNIRYFQLTVESIGSPLDSIFLFLDVPNQEISVGKSVNGVEQRTYYNYGGYAGKIKTITGNCCGFQRSFFYGANNNLTQERIGASAPFSDWFYEYDSRGNITKETDPLGGITNYTYEPIYNKVLTKKDKRGNITNYSYDPQGNLIHERKRGGITNSYSYDVHGNVSSYTNGNGNSTGFQYNNSGDITLVNYPDRSTNFFTYDNVGNMKTHTDGNGNTTSYFYDAMNRLIQTQDALGNSTYNTYDGKGNLTSTMDELGRVTIHRYDALNRKTSMTSPAGTTSMTYDQQGNLLTQTDNNGNTTRYAYDTRNQRISETNALGVTRNFGYDNLGFKDFETDFSSHVTDFVFDKLNRMVQKTDALSNNTFYLYDANSNLTQVTDAKGRITKYFYDDSNRLFKIEYPIGTLNIEYDNNNNVTSIVDPIGNRTRFIFDNMDRRFKTIDALGRTIHYKLDKNGNICQVTDRNGHISTYLAYDKLNRKIREGNALGELTSIEYDAVGNVRSRSLPSGNVITYNYDAADRNVSSSDLMGSLGSYTYDPNSNVATQTSSTGLTTINKYDALNRLTRVRDPMGGLTNYTYNNNSNILSVQDRNGKITSYTYDALERRISTNSPEGNTTTMSYDDVGNLETITDDNARTTSYIYDDNDRLVIETFANGANTFYTYDNNGNTKTRKDNNNLITLYNYDALNRLTSKAGENFTYDSEGNLITANNINANITFTYDDADRIISENLNGRITNYSYDIPGRKRFITYPGGRVVAENYDLRLRLSGINSGIGVSYIYDTDDRVLTRNYSNGVNTGYTYNNNSWITSVSDIKLPTTISKFNYTFDKEGNRLTSQKIHRPSNSEKYGYDFDQRLTNYKEGTLVGTDIPSPITQTQYNYDGVDNRISIVKDALTTTYTINNVNSYTNVTDSVSVNPVHDANGNTTNDGRHSYAFDFEDRLTSVDAGATASYKYDALGRRIQKVTSVGTINYYYDDNRIIEERDGIGTVKATYVYGSEVDDILSMKRDGNDYFYHQNSLGSVVAITDNSGAAAERYEYDAYGKPTIYSGSYVLRTTTAIGNNLMFTGREYDAESKIYHYRARFYKPDWGRFAQWDPMKYLDGMNLYNYVINNPLNLIDPFGLEWEWPTWWDASNFVSGIDESYSEGITRELRKQLGIENVVDRCSPAYGAGAMIGTALGFVGIKAVGGLIKKGVGIIGKGVGRKKIAGVITGYHPHGFDRAVLATRAGGKDGGVSPRAILDAVKNPVKTEKTLNKRGEKGVKYIGKDAIIFINDKGQIWNAIPRNSAGRRIPK